VLPLFGAETTYRMGNEVGNLATAPLSPKRLLISSDMHFFRKNDSNYRADFKQPLPNEQATPFRLDQCRRTTG
jgi:hypothetical protein